jgi:tetratricopeptide (TPR) repeat protein/nucleoside-triphosphatase THEP1
LSRARIEEKGVFIDRQEPLVLLRRLLQEVESRGEGRCLFLTGAPGIGKTSLINKFLTEVSAESILVLRGAGLQFASSPFSALAEPFEEVVKLGSRRGQEVAVTVVNISRLIPVLGQYVETAADTVKELQGLRNVDVRTISNSQYVKNVFLALFQKISKKKSVVVFFDDVQWFDVSSLEVLGFLASHIKKARILLIVTFRQGHPVLEREEDNFEIITSIMNSSPYDATTKLALEPFPLDISRQAVRELAGKDLIDEDQVDLLAKRTGGNPLFISKTILEVANLSAEGKLQQNFESSNLGRIIPETVFDTIKRLLFRIGKENSNARVYLDYAAILGRKFTITDLAGLAQSDSLMVKHELEMLDSVYGIIKPAGLANAYEFDHDLTREAIEMQMGTFAREIHLKTANYYIQTEKAALAPEMVAYHYEEGGENGLAFQYYLGAAGKARANYAYSDEARFLEKCLSLQSEKVGAGVQTRQRIHLMLAEALFSNGEFERSFLDLSSLIETAPRTYNSFEADAYLLAGRCCRYLGTAEKGRKGIEYLELSARLFEERKDVHKTAIAFSVLSTLYDHFGRLEKAIDCFGKSQRFYNQARDSIGLATLQRKSGMIYDSRRAIDFINHALAVFERTGSMIEVGRCLNNLGAEQFYIGQFEAAEASLLRAVETYRRIDSYEVDAPLNNLGMVLTQAGRMRQALRFLSEADQRASEDFDKICIASNIASIERLEQEPEKAHERLSGVTGLVKKSGEPLIQDYFAFNMAAVLGSLGKPREAMEWLEMYPPNSWKRDDGLVDAKRSSAKSKFLRMLGDSAEAEEVRLHAEAILRTTRPQKWFYALDYYPCDIHLLD